MMKIEQYLIIKNMLSLELHIAFEKLNMLYARGNVYKICGENTTTDDMLLEINELKKKITTLNECYKAEMSFEKTVEKLALLPTE